MCQPNDGNKSSRRKLGRVVVIFTLILATVSLSLFQLQLSPPSEGTAVIKPNINNNNFTVTSKDGTRTAVFQNVALDFNNETSKTLHILSSHNVSLCSQIRNEPIEDVVEWLTYYRLVYSVDGICIIDDQSTIDYRSVFKAFNVKTIPSKNDRNQNFDLCRKCLNITGDTQNRIFITDIDEYIYIKEEERFAEYLSLFSQVSLRTLNFANANTTRTRSNTSLILDNVRRAPHYCLHESYNHSLDCRQACWYDTYKSISSVSTVKQFLPHANKVNGITVEMPCDIATVHHYFIRSREEFQDKYAWDVDSKWNVGSKYGNVLENIEYYTQYYDDGLKRYVLDTFPDYPLVLQEYKDAFLVDDTNNSTINNTSDSR